MKTRKIFTQDKEAARGKFSQCQGPRLCLEAAHKRKQDPWKNVIPGPGRIRGDWDEGCSDGGG